MNKIKRIICKINHRTAVAILSLILSMQLSIVHSIKCWNCGYAEDEKGNRMKIPVMFDDKGIPFCDDFINGTANTNSAKDYPKVRTEPLQFTI